ncbi:hypothetical protein Efla_005186 [Eimeria flavescens]
MGAGGTRRHSAALGTNARARAQAAECQGVRLDRNHCLFCLASPRRGDPDTAALGASGSASGHRIPGSGGEAPDGYSCSLTRRPMRMSSAKLRLTS